MSEVIRIGMDLSKSVFGLYGDDQQENCPLKSTLKRAEVMTGNAKAGLPMPGRLPTCLMTHWNDLMFWCLASAQCQIQSQRFFC